MYEFTTDHSTSIPKQLTFTGAIAISSSDGPRVENFVHTEIIEVYCQLELAAAGVGVTGAPLVSGSPVVSLLVHHQHGSEIALQPTLVCVTKYCMAQGQPTLVCYKVLYDKRSTRPCVCYKVL